MSQYGHQHELPYPHLTSKGLFGFFTREHDGFRFWTPWEIACLHLHYQGGLLLKPAKVSWQILGNMIVLPHAVLTWINMLEIDNNSRPDDMCYKIQPASETFQKLMAERTTISQTTRIQDDMAWYFGTNKQAEHYQQQLAAIVSQLGSQPDENGMIAISFPPGKWWHPDLGIQGGPEPEVSSIETFPLVVDDYTVKIKAGPGHYGEYHLHDSYAMRTTDMARLKTDQDRLLPHCSELCAFKDVSFDKEDILLVSAHESNIQTGMNTVEDIGHPYVMVYMQGKLHIFQALQDETLAHLQQRFARSIRSNCTTLSHCSYHLTSRRPSTGTTLHRSVHSFEYCLTLTCSLPCSRAIDPNSRPSMLFGSLVFFRYHH